MIYSLFIVVTTSEDEFDWSLPLYNRYEMMCGPCVTTGATTLNVARPAITRLRVTWRSKLALVVTFRHRVTEAGPEGGGPPRPSGPRAIGFSFFLAQSQLSFFIIALNTTYSATPLDSARDVSGYWLGRKQLLRGKYQIWFGYI